MTPADIQRKEFRLAFRGYNERDVDEFLDEVTGELGALIEENGRLREGSGGGFSAHPYVGQDAADAQLEAEAVLAHARDEAASIVREAEGRAAALEAATPAVPLSGSEARVVSAFLSNEREFLQGLASLIQGHAETVKAMARSAREGMRTEGPEGRTTPASDRPGSGPAPWSPPTEPPAVPAANRRAAEPEPPRRPILTDRPARISAILSPEATGRAGEGEPSPAGSSAVAAEGDAVAAAEAQPADASEDLVDVTEEAVGETEQATDEAEPSVDQTEPARVAVESTDPRRSRDQGERSLRDLFWGED